MGLCCCSRRGVLAVLQVLAVTLLLSAGGCADDALPPGVVATVNGHPVNMKLLQATHDAYAQSWTGAEGPSVEALRSQYGAVLADLVVQELVLQKLAAVGASVTDAELGAAEAEVRGDYPEGMFEAALVEDYLDLEVWREMLRRRLALTKFAQVVLRSEVAISLEEVESWYRGHQGEFRLAARVRFIMVEGDTREGVEAATGAVASGAAPEEVEKAFPGMSGNELLIRRDRIPAAWQKALAALKPGGVSPPLAFEGRWVAFRLIESLPAQDMSVVDAYPVIERRLLEEKLDAAFDVWVERNLAGAKVRVSQHLAGTKEAVPGGGGAAQR